MRTLRLLLAVLLTFLAVPVFAKTLTLGIDQSSSTPWTTDRKSAEVAARFIYQQIASLKPNDIVVVKTFADLSSAHIDSRTYKIDRRNRAPQVAARVAGYVASLPTQTLQGTGETNILAFLQFTKSFDCENSGSIVLLTDGVEESQYTSQHQLFSGKPLPPNPGLLKGCDVTMWGIAQSVDGHIPPKAKTILRDAWTRWMKDAGVRSFTPIVDP